MNFCILTREDPGPNFLHSSEGGPVLEFCNLPKEDPVLGFLLSSDGGPSCVNHCILLREEPRA